MEVTIIGAGNVGTQLAVHYASQGASVKIYSSKPHLFKGKLAIIDSNNKVLAQGQPKLVTNSLKAAVGGSELVLITVPAFLMTATAKKLTPYLKAGMKVGLIPGSGGAELAFKDALAKGVVVFGLQRVPSVARLKKYGQLVVASGYRPSLYLAALPRQASEECCRLISWGLGMPCYPLASYLNLALTPSNPILHTSRLYRIFKDYRPGKVYSHLPLFYEDWDDESTVTLFKADAEVQALCQRLVDFDLSGVKSLKEHYGQVEVGAFSAKIRSIASFKGLKTPSLAVAGGLVPDFSSRYFRADFAFGLRVILQIGKLAQQPLPTCQSLMTWYESLPQAKPAEFSYASYGIKHLADLVAFYQR
ncbi:NAD/NADP octopine/nopaline dehydrogenase [Ligilactobacillus agilis]|nr:NAD/NADP octopine/nopaline dehydrogenase [Ligilactobacillus agilis]